MPLRTDSREVSLHGKIRCLLLLNQILLRQGVRRLLEDEPDIEVVGEAGNEAECLHKVHELQPDVVVADARMLDIGESEAELQFTQDSPRTRIVFLTTQEQTVIPVSGLREAPACAARQTSAQELVEMIRNACGVARPSLAEIFSRPEPQAPTEIRPPHKRSLTAREREVLKLLAEGMTVRAAAGVLGLSVKTVDAHKFNLMRKLGIHNKAALVMWAIQRNVVKVPVNF